jgi:hypothetical protein
VLHQLQQALQLALSIPMAVQNSHNYARGTIDNDRRDQLNMVGFISDGTDRRLPNQEITTSVAKSNRNAFISSIYAHMEHSHTPILALSSTVSVERRISEISAPYGSNEAATLESLVSQLVTDYSCL